LNDGSKSGNNNYQRYRWVRCIGGPIYKIIDALKNYEPNRQYHAAQERAGNLTAYATVAMAAVSVAIFVVGIFQYCVFNKQLSVMQGQLEEMKTARITDQRPWVVVTGVDLDHGGGLGIPVNGQPIELTFGIDIKVLGASPAQRVFARADIVPNPFIMGKPVTLLLNRQKQFCDGLKSRVMQNRSLEETSVFPGQTPFIVVRAKEKPGTFIHNAGKTDIFPTVVGCVVYADQTGFPHQTGLIYDIQRNDHQPIHFIGGITPMNELAFVPSEIGNGPSD
jgi:hypothetical protein